MKALLILIVTVGTSQASIDTVDSKLDVRQIEFASMSSCEQAAARLNNAGQSTVNWSKTFAQASATFGTVGGPTLFVSPPTVIAECVKVD